MLKEPKLYDVELYDFPWFYNTWLDIDYDFLAACEDLTYDEWDKMYEITYDNYHKYMVDTAKLYYDKYIETYAEYLIKAWIDIKYFHSLNCPKYYNYSNDSIDAFITVDIPKLKRYLKKNKDDFDTHVHKHYTSYDGFWSWISNSYDEFVQPNKLTSSNHLWAVIRYITSRPHLSRKKETLMYDVLDNIEPYAYVSTIPTSDIEQAEPSSNAG